MADLSEQWYNKIEWYAQPGQDQYHVLEAGHDYRYEDRGAYHNYGQLVNGEAYQHAEARRQYEQCTHEEAQRRAGQQQQYQLYEQAQLAAEYVQHAREQRAVEEAHRKAEELWRLQLRE